MVQTLLHSALPCSDLILSATVWRWTIRCVGSTEFQPHRLFFIIIYLSPISQSFSTTCVVFINVADMTNQLQRVTSFIGFIQIELFCVSTWIISSWNHNCAVFTLCFYFYTALLDLPVQPSASEVLGFGQTANASPSALPFRFYEQSRRAPNDPTANRSVFASVDKVPGDKNLNKLSRLPYYFRENRNTSVDTDWFCHLHQNSKLERQLVHIVSSCALNKSPFLVLRKTLDTWNTASQFT